MQTIVITANEKNLSSITRICDELDKQWSLDGNKIIVKGENLMGLIDKLTMGNPPLVAYNEIFY